MLALAEVWLDGLPDGLADPLADPVAEAVAVELVARAAVVRLWRASGCRNRKPLGKGSPRISCRSSTTLDTEAAAASSSARSAASRSAAGWAARRASQAR